MEHKRKCIGCGQIKPRNELIKITKDYLTGNVIITSNSKIFGRSVYLCYNQLCIKEAMKKNKLNKALKTNKDVKGLLNEQFKG